MLVQITYWSKAVGTLSTDNITKLAENAQHNNSSSSITGCMLVINGFFLQTLEGHSTAINSLFHKISIDSRHTQVTLVQYNQILKRRFDTWLCAIEVPDYDDKYRRILMQYTSRMPFSFEDMTSAATDMLMDEIYLRRK